jgi:DNA-binding LacI/PurR family transcriptional regulator
VGLRDVAQRLGVSAVTVSNAYNRPDQLSPALRQRVLAVAAELGYAGPQPAARMLRTGRAGAIALYNHDPITHLLEDPTATAFMSGVSELCHAHQVGLLILPGAVSGRPGASAIDAAAVDGFILYALAEDDPGRARVLARRQPVVGVDVDPIAGAASVGIDDRAAAEQAAAHVLGLGHRALAILALELDAGGRTGLVDPDRITAAASFRVTHERWRGYADAAAHAGIDPRRIPVFETAGNSEAGGEAGARAFLLAAAPRPTAILAMSDRLALGVLRAARALELRVPEDLAVVGFDDIPEAAAAGLTTLRQPSREKGRVAARLLLEDAVAGERPRVLLPTELVVRRSTRPAVA